MQDVLQRGGDREELGIDAYFGLSAAFPDSDGYLDSNSARGTAS